MLKVGDKVVPHDKSLGCSLKESMQCRLAAEKGQEFLYIVSIDKTGDFWCSCTNDKVDAEWFQKTDLTPYIEEKSKESGIFLNFIGITFSKYNGKEILDLLERGILKETYEFIIGRK